MRALAVLATVMLLTVRAGSEPLPDQDAASEDPLVEILPVEPLLANEMATDVWSGNGCPRVLFTALTWRECTNRAHGSRGIL